MKILAILFLVGLASAASFRETVDVAANELAESLVRDIQQYPKVTAWLSGEDEKEEKLTKEEVEKRLREILDNVLAKIRDAIKHGKKVREDFLEKMNEIQEKMKELNIDVGDKQKELLEKIKEKARDFFKDLLEKLGKSTTDDRVMKSDLNIKDLLRQLRDILKEKIDLEVLKKKIIELFGEGTQIVHELLQTLKEKGKNKLRILLDLILDDDEDEDERASRGISDMWEKVKDYFKDLKITLQEKYMKFGEWVKNTLGESFENSKDRMSNIKAIAKEFLKHVKGVSKEVAGEAREFLRQYKEDLGTLWDEVNEAVREVYNRKDE